ncbi:PilW family protein [Methylocaldum gracile]|jgi:type IV pilus assembly protein PilW|nr:hypothetical protein [Methylocaldum sp. BRCS4]
MSRLIHTTTFRQSGVGLVELMVALVLGLFVTAGVTSMFVQNKGSYNQDERNARMQENARYALQLLARDLSMAGFWGGVVGSGSDIDSSGPSTAGTGAAWAYNLASTIDYFVPSVAAPAPTSRFAWFSVPSGSSYKSNTNILAVKHVSGVNYQNPSTPPAGVYVSTVGAGGTLATRDGVTQTPAGMQDWEYQSHMYYIATDDTTGVPWLRRKHLVNGAMSEQGEGELVEGIEFLYVEFGIDTDGDGIPNRYLSNPSATQLQTAVSARISLLVRSSDQDFSSPADDKTYLLVDADGDGAYDSGVDVSVNGILNGGNAFNDHYYRRMYTTTVQLRNTQYQLLLQGATAS